MYRYSIYNSMYMGINVSDIFGLLQIAQLIAVRYELLVGITGTVAWSYLQLPPLLCSQLVH